MHSFKVEGIIVKRRNFGEADRILTVFTKRQGKQSIIAKGVRKITSRRSPHTELLNHGILSLYKGKSLPILTEVQSFQNFSKIKINLTKIGFAYHLCELIDGLCPENQENLRVFDLFLETLERLSKEENIAEIVHGFEIELLSTLGFYKPEIHTRYFNISSFIESLLERKLKSRQIFQKLAS